MRLLHLTPGTGHFHCGGCIRDHTLIRALRRGGHDVVLAPIYLPILTDSDQPDAHPSLFFGGLRTFLHQACPILQRVPSLFTHWLDHPRLLAFISRHAPMTSGPSLGPMTLSMLRDSHQRQLHEIHRLAHWVRGQEPIHAIALSNALLIGLARPLKQVFNLPVLCSLQGEDTFIDDLRHPWSTAVWDQLSSLAAHVDRFIAPSAFFRNHMSRRMRLQPDHCALVPNGLSHADFVPAPRPEAAPVLGYLARLCPQKGLGRLVDAFIALKADARFASLRLLIAGTRTGSDGRYVKTLIRRLARANLLHLVEIHPNVTHAEKIALLHRMSMMCVPVQYDEAFGLYAVEAMAAGVPVVLPRRGGLTEIVERGCAGILYDPHDPAQPVGVIQQLLLDPHTCHALSLAGPLAAAEHFSDDRMAELFARQVEQLICPLPRDCIAQPASS